MLTNLIFYAKIGIVKVIFTDFGKNFQKSNKMSENNSKK